MKITSDPPPSSTTWGPSFHTFVHCSLSVLSSSSMTLETQEQDRQGPHLLATYVLIGKGTPRYGSSLEEIQLSRVEINW